MRQRHFDGTHSKPRKLLENAATPTTTPAWFAKQTTCGASVAPALFAGDRVHAVLARKCVTKCDDPKTLCCYHNPLVPRKNHFL